MPLGLFQQPSVLLARGCPLGGMPFFSFPCCWRPIKPGHTPVYSSATCISVFEGFQIKKSLNTTKERFFQGFSMSGGAGGAGWGTKVRGRRNCSIASINYIWILQLFLYLIFFFSSTFFFVCQILLEFQPRCTESNSFDQKNGRALYSKGRQSPEVKRCFKTLKPPSSPPLSQSL